MTPTSWKTKNRGNLTDPMVWYELLSGLPPENYDDHDEDLWTANSGTYESSLELEDSEGNQIS